MGYQDEKGDQYLKGKSKEFTKLLVMGVGKERGRSSQGF